MKPFEILDHTADIGIVAHGASREELFANAALGMFSILVNPDTVRPGETLDVRVQADDLDSLLADFLAELLYRLEVGRFVLHHAEVKTLTDTAIEAVIHGEPISPRHDFGTEIKAVTHHDLRIEQQPDGWRATVLFDI